MKRQGVVAIMVAAVVLAGWIAHHASGGEAALAQLWSLCS